MEKNAIKNKFSVQKNVGIAVKIKNMKFTFLPIIY